MFVTVRTRVADRPVANASKTMLDGVLAAECSGHGQADALGKFGEMLPRLGVPAGPEGPAGGGPEGTLRNAHGAQPKEAQGG